MSDCINCPGVPVMRCPDGDNCPRGGWVHLGVNNTHICDVERRLVAAPKNPPPEPRKKTRGGRR